MAPRTSQVGPSGKVVVKRGQIWWATLPPPSGSEPGYRRPVLIIQANSFNQSNIGTIIGAILTSNLRLGDAPGNVHLSRRQSGLPRESVVNVSQIVTLDRSFLTAQVGRIPLSKQREVDNGLRLVLGL